MLAAYSRAYRKVSLVIAQIETIIIGCSTLTVHTFDLCEVWARFEPKCEIFHLTVDCREALCWLLDEVSDHLQCNFSLVEKVNLDIVT